MADFDRAGGARLAQAKMLAENRGASPRAQALSGYTGFVARDIDAISMFCVQRELLIIFRCPDFNANSYVAQVKDGSYWMKPSHIKTKTGEDGLVSYGGRAYVSDYDLMCVHRLNRRTRSYEAVSLSWDGKSNKPGVEAEIIGRLNETLIFKLQHGCNDNYVFESADGNRHPLIPRNPHIGGEFLAFRGRDIDFVMGKSTLRSQFYSRFGLAGWHQAYGY